MKKIIAIFVLLFLTIPVESQERRSPKKIKIKGEYLFENKIIFPEIFENFNRTDIYSFTKDDKNIGVSYEDQNINTKISIYLYPTIEASEGRLRNEYFASMQSIANYSKNRINANQKPINFIGEKFKCNGIKAELVNEDNNFNQLIIYECGSWFYKVRITSKACDSIQTKKFEQKIIQKFDPSLLTEISHLRHKADIYFSKSAFRDSIMLGSIMGSAFKKIEWVNENIKDNERASGFPDMYLDMQIESFKELVKFETKHKYKKTPQTIKYLDEINSIINAGFLGEFLMEKYDYLLIVNDDEKLNFGAYYKWKESNVITIDWGLLYYVISYKSEQ